jgi:hypothetical protein
MRRFGLPVLVLAIALVGLLGVTAGGADASAEPAVPLHPLPIRSGGVGLGSLASKLGDLPDAAAAGKAAKPSGNGISYHGGPVMTAATTNAYVIWYGDWSNNTGPAITTDFLNFIGGSPYFNINTTYYNGSGVKVTNSVTYGGSTNDAGSQGITNLSNTAILNIVSLAITDGLPKDPDGVYFVLTAKNVTKSGFLTQYCGWHSYATIGSTTIKYSFVGDPTGPSLGNCAAQSTSPNGNPGVDAMLSVVAHELEEAVTDPKLNAWYDSRGYENADKCAWTFGATYTAANGSKANMNLGGKDYLIQRNWVNATGGYCALKY